MEFLFPEAEGLVLAQRALELAQASLDDNVVATVSHTLSLALFAVGQDEEALEASRAALEVAPEEWSDWNLGFRGGALHSCAESSAVEPGEGQMGNVA